MSGEVDEAELGAFRRHLVRSFRERGAMTATEADLWLGGAGHSPKAFYLRLAALALAYRKGKRKARIEDDDFTRDQYDYAIKLKGDKYSRRTWQQVADLVGISPSQLYRWRSRLRQKP